MKADSRHLQEPIQVTLDQQDLKLSRFQETTVEGVVPVHLALTNKDQPFHVVYWQDAHEQHISIRAGMCGRLPVVPAYCVTASDLSHNVPMLLNTVVD